MYVSSFSKKLKQKTVTIVLYLSLLQHYVSRCRHVESLTTCPSLTAVLCLFHQDLTYLVTGWGFLNGTCDGLTLNTQFILNTSTLLTVTPPNVSNLFEWWNRVNVTATTNTKNLLQSVAFTFLGWPPGPVQPLTRKNNQYSITFIYYFFFLNQILGHLR